ncbi:hypothetical protein AB0D11_18645 [Streptomyces monashensis]|uniref:hypothetical protein n=1 Tax=Streptomyces monashensis TaxID=1678012 RepID=UPI0033D108E0
MALATLVAGGEAAHPELDSGIISDILWAAARPDDGLEHIHVRSAAGRIDVTFFHRAESLSAALAAAGDICRRSLDSSPVLRGWGFDAPHPDSVPGVP